MHIMHMSMSFIYLPVQVAGLSLFSLCCHSTTHTAKAHCGLKTLRDIKTVFLEQELKKQDIPEHTHTC